MKYIMMLCLSLVSSLSFAQSNGFAGMIGQLMGGQNNTSQQNYNNTSYNNVNTNNIPTIRFIGQDAMINHTVISVSDLYENPEIVANQLQKYPRDATKLSQWLEQQKYQHPEEGQQAEALQQRFGLMTKNGQHQAAYPTRGYSNAPSPNYNTGYNYPNAPTNIQNNQQVLVQPRMSNVVSVPVHSTESATTIQQLLGQ